MMKRLLSRRSRFERASDDSGVALITALLAILVTAMFAIVMLGVLMSQVMPTQLEQATTRTVFAAEAGVNVVVGQIRNAQNGPDGTGKIYGQRSMLPCTSTGEVTSGGSTLGYVATIQYFIEDPSTEDTAWRDSHDLDCVPGAGPSEDPTHALIKSTGTGLVVPSAQGDIARTIEAVYAFQVTNSNIPGGFIKSWDRDGAGAEDRYCLYAELPNPGSYVRYRPAAECVEGSATQMWLYAPDYTIKLASTTLPSYGPKALCITGNPNGSTAVRVTLEYCKDPTDSTRWNQLWAWNENGTWRAENTSISDYANSYLSTGVANGIGKGSYLQVWNQTGKGEWESFNPDPRVGPGAASIDTIQIVNYAEFGRCTDVTFGDVGQLKMIAYPCKQDPSILHNKLDWNHKWHYDEPVDKKGTKGPQQIYVMQYNTTKYCLKSAGTEGGYVTFSTACTSTNKAFQWTRVAKAASYDESWLFIDGFGRCLDLGERLNAAESWSTLVTKQCTLGSLNQKWNAPANVSASTLDGYWELAP